MSCRDRSPGKRPGELLRVPRETLDRLQAYLDLLAVWQRRINLVGPATLADPWRRHVVDCGQLWRFWPDEARTLVDLGSGAGLPGLVLAVLGVPTTHLVESDRRKAAFLREAARACGVQATVHAARIEDLPPLLGADVVTARALAPLPELLALAEPQLRPGAVCLFLKGRAAEAELTLARETWKMAVDRRASLSDPDGQGPDHQRDPPCRERTSLSPPPTLGCSPSPTRRAGSARPRPRSTWAPRWVRRSHRAGGRPRPAGQRQHRVRHRPRRPPADLLRRAAAGDAVRRGARGDPGAQRRPRAGDGRPLGGGGRARPRRAARLPAARTRSPP